MSEPCVKFNALPCERERESIAVGFVQKVPMWQDLQVLFVTKDGGFSTEKIV